MLLSCCSLAFTSRCLHSIKKLLASYYHAETKTANESRPIICAGFFCVVRRERYIWISQKKINIYIAVFKQIVYESYSFHFLFLLYVCLELTNKLPIRNFTSYARQHVVLSVYYRSYRILLSVCLSACPSVRPSVTTRYRFKPR